MRSMEEFLLEDLGSGDITTDALIDEGLMGSAIIRANESCVLAGLEEADQVFQMLGLGTSCLAEDGSRLRKGQKVLRVEGSVKRILIGERLALNFLMRMSGIATITNRLVSQARKENRSIRIAATRKTTPGFRLYEKKAVALGGGDPHRFGLSDAVLIKDNHIKAIGGVSEAVRRAKMVSFTKKVEVEVENLHDAKEAASARADIIMLDNMTVAQVKRASNAIRSIDPSILVEVSGGINSQNMSSYAKYADIISMGCITHSVKAVQYNLHFE